nr:hypothetical transcript [Hymenolepis microstoma]
MRNTTSEWLNKFYGSLANLGSYSKLVGSDAVLKSRLVSVAIRYKLNVKLIRIFKNQRKSPCTKHTLSELKRSLRIFCGDTTLA